MEFETVHIIELLPALLKEKGIRPDGKGIEVTYQDPCRLGRMEGLYEEPREALRLCGIEVGEMPHNREEALCCGAGAGMRSVYRDLSHEMAVSLLGQAPVDPLVTSCPFCAFNLNSASKKAGKDRETVYITEMVLNSLPSG